MDEEKTEVPEVELVRVNKYRSNWAAETLFSGFNYRVVLRFEPDHIKSIQRMKTMKQKLSAESGVEGEDWMVFTNVGSKHEDIVYLKNSVCLVMWKMLKHTEFNDNVERVEEHDETVADGEEVQW